MAAARELAIAAGKVAPKARARAGLRTQALTQMPQRQRSQPQPIPTGQPSQAPGPTTTGQPSQSPGPTPTGQPIAAQQELPPHQSPVVATQTTPPHVEDEDEVMAEDDQGVPFTQEQIATIIGE